MIDNCKSYLVKGSKVESKTLNLFTVESKISKELEDIQNKYYSNLTIGSYPFFRLGKIGVSVVIRSENKKKLIKCYKEIKKMVILKKIKFY